MGFLISNLESLPWGIATALLIILYVTFAISGIFIVRKLVSLSVLQGHQDVAGFVFTNLGVLYGVLLGFTVVNAQQRFDKLKETTEVEACYLAELYQDAETFEEKHKQEIRSIIIKYCQNVINEEWTLMAMKQVPGKNQLLTDLWKAYYTIDLKTPKQKIWYSESIRKLNLLLNARLIRTLGSKDSLGPEMWTLLILGSIIMVAFLWFFGVENMKSLILMTSILATSTILLLFLIYSLDTAFTGQVNVKPDAIAEVLRSFNAA